MLLKPQPLASDVSKKLMLESEHTIKEISEKNIISQRIGKPFDDIIEKVRKSKISLKRRLGWRWQHTKELFSDLKFTLRNHIRWHKTISELRPWTGFGGVIDVMITHLKDYVAYEEQFGHSTAECKNEKISSANAVIELLARIKEPEEYPNRRCQEIKRKYPEYKYLITKYDNGSTDLSGDFVAQGSGWTGIESGTNPREGYFEFVDRKFELITSPDQQSTDQLLSEIRQYRDELSAAYKLAEVDSDKDFECLGQLLKDNLYTWRD